MDIAPSISQLIIEEAGLNTHMYLHNAPITGINLYYIRPPNTTYFSLSYEYITDHPGYRYQLIAAQKSTTFSSIAARCKLCPTWRINM